MSEAIQKPELFVRKASGIVRQGTPWRMFAFNIGWSGMVYVAMAYGFTPAVFPGANLPIGIILAVAGMGFLGLLYSMFSAAMPRSGGDYVFVSRTLGPWVGFTVNFVEAMCYVFWIAWGAYWFSYMVLSGLFTTMGSVFANPAMVEWGAAFATTGWAFAVGTVVHVLIGLVTLVNMKTYYRFQNVEFILGILGIVVIILVFLFSTQADFIASFNQYASSNFGLQDAYQAIISRAEAAGYPASPGFSFGDTLGIFAIIWIMGIGTAYISGEVKDVRKSQMWGIVGGSLANGLIVLIIAVTMLNVVGEHFNGAANYLSLSAPDQYPLPVPPYYNLWVSVLLQNPIVLALVGLGLIAWGFYALPQNTIIISRMFLAWSIDRVMPTRMADVNQRFHTPHVAIIVTLVLSELCLIFYAFTPWFLALAPLLPISFAFIAVGIAGIVFPYLKQTKAIYRASGVAWEVFGIPVFVICGVITVIYWIATLYYELSFPALGLTSPGAIIFAVTVYALGIIIYAIAWLYRRREGLSIQNAFKELPPE